MIDREYDLIVIGGGSGGLTAAIGGAGIGAKVLLIEKDKIGGDCTHHGCVPSKTLIKAAKVARNLQNYEHYGLTKGDFKYKNNLKDVLKKVQRTVHSIAKHETPKALEKFGITSVIGEAKFVDNKTVNVNGHKVISKRIILSTGSRARVVPIKGLEEAGYMTNKQIFDPKNYKSIAVIGAGPIGSEISQALNTLGVKVHLLNDRHYIMGREDSEAAMFVQKIFEREGVIIHSNKNVVEIKKKGTKKVVYFEDKVHKKKDSIEVDEILLAIGRVPNIEGLDLEKAGIEFTNRGVKINAKGQTTNKRVYAVGDVAGGFQFTHLANHHAKMALASSIFKVNAKYETQVIPRVTFTAPEVASVGISEDQMKQDECDYIVLKKKYSEIDRAITDSNEEGFFKIIVDKKGFIKGAVLVGEGSGELIGEVSLAIKNNITISKFAETIHPYPTYSYGLRHTCDLFRAQGYTENKKKWVKRVFGLKGN